MTSVAELKRRRAAILARNRGRYGSQVTGDEALDAIEAEFARRGLTINGEKPRGLCSPTT